MTRCLIGSDAMAKYVITDETSCKSSPISVHTICHFKTTIYTPYIAIVNSVKKDQTVPLEEVRSGFTLFAQA